MRSWWRNEDFPAGLSSEFGRTLLFFLFSKYVPQSSVCGCSLARIGSSPAHSFLSFLNASSTWHQSSSDLDISQALNWREVVHVGLFLRCSARLAVRAAVRSEHCSKGLRVLISQLLTVEKNRSIVRTSRPWFREFGYGPKCTFDRSEKRTELRLWRLPAVKQSEPFLAQLSVRSKLPQICLVDVLRTKSSSVGSKEFGESFSAIWPGRCANLFPDRIRIVFCASERSQFFPHFSTAHVNSSPAHSTEPLTSQDAVIISRRYGDDSSFTVRAHRACQQQQHPRDFWYSKTLGAYRESNPPLLSSCLRTAERHITGA
ncbi:hypothetical protein AXG93_728s1010 [Marchantia polymorpha subsp. ruderalis]|uniref:Uncharacterized protein n=1 Tax=Marchantia polymorpha subsp. ruderalis TaxID=1480154 RepID=A0A176VUW9_MARPO|nr:hypothetical protein AXG93_728s1010 [Marchantia polymorpha subsp. ruderalis]